jgi:hypothetical protein
LCRKRRWLYHSKCTERRLPLGWARSGPIREVRRPLRDYLGHGDSVSLANIIHITRQLYQTHDIVPRGQIPALSWGRLRVHVTYTKLHSLNLTYRKFFLDYSTTFVPCGTNPCKKCGEACTTASPSIFPSPSVVLTLTYIKALMPPRQPSLLPPPMTT